MLKDFKAFILRGNVMDLAVAVVIGAAFKDVIDALVKYVLIPLVSIPGTANFDTYTFAIRHTAIGYGFVLTEIVKFLSVAAAVFFFVVKPVNALMARRKTEPDVESTTKECDYCLSKVPSRAIVCAFCTREIAAPPAAAV